MCSYLFSVHLFSSHQQPPHPKTHMHWLYINLKNLQNKELQPHAEVANGHITFVKKK